MVSGSLNLLRSTIESRVVVIFDGTVAVVVAAGVPDAPLKELRSALMTACMFLSRRLAEIDWP